VDIIWFFTIFILFRDLNAHTFKVYVVRLFDNTYNVSKLFPILQLNVICQTFLKVVFDLE